MDLPLLLDWVFDLLALASVLFLMYGGWLVFDFHFPQSSGREPEPIEHTPDELPHL
jgi:hypothetical protein